MLFIAQCCPGDIAILTSLILASTVFHMFDFLQACFIMGTKNMSLQGQSLLVLKSF